MKHKEKDEKKKLKNTRIDLQSKLKVYKKKKEKYIKKFIFQNQNIIDGSS